MGHRISHERIVGKGQFQDIEIESKVLEGIARAMRQELFRNPFEHGKPCPFVVPMLDRLELKHFVTQRIHAKHFPETPIVWACTDREVREALDPEVKGVIGTLVVVEGDAIPDDLQIKIASSEYRRPGVFLILTEEDPGVLFQRRLWLDLFRRRMHPTIQWPRIAERPGDWMSLFRRGVEIAAERLELPAVPQIEKSVYEGLQQWMRLERVQRETNPHYRLSVAELINFAGWITRVSAESGGTVIQKRHIVDAIVAQRAAARLDDGSVPEAAAG